MSLGLLPQAEQNRLAAALAAAGISVVALPASNLYLQGRDRQECMPRALTAIRALTNADVNLAAGWDNLQDPFNPVDNQEMVAQMAQFSSLAGVSETNTVLKSISEQLAAQTALLKDIKAGQTPPATPPATPTT